MQDLPSSMDRPVGYALIGAGAFGQYCLDQFASLDSVQRVAVFDTDQELAKQVAKSHDLAACDSVDVLLAHQEVEIVHLATPPSTHRELAIRAMDAGKHVLCEKPLALTMEDGQAMVDVAKQTQRVCSANLIMRHNPLCEKVKAILDADLFGPVIHASFVNDAKDESLEPDHWFWDASNSGGIFIEHGVHFFDVFSWWLGQGKVIGAHEMASPLQPKIIEQVIANVRYDDATLAWFYHGFTQANRMDRQGWRLVCERSEIRLSEWVPTEMVIDGLLTETALSELIEILGISNDAVQTIETYQGSDRLGQSRHRAFEADARYVIQCDAGMDKPALYGEMLRRLLHDQCLAIRNPQHARRITEDNAIQSLTMAVEAQRLATASNSA